MQIFGTFFLATVYTDIVWLSADSHQTRCELVYKLFNQNEVRLGRESSESVMAILGHGSRWILKYSHVCCSICRSIGLMYMSTGIWWWNA